MSIARVEILDRTKQCTFQEKLAKVSKALEKGVQKLITEHVPKITFFNTI